MPASVLLPPSYFSLSVLQYPQVHMLTGSLTTKKASEYIFTSEAPLHLQSHSSLIFPGTSHSRLIVKDDALAPR